MSIFDKKQMSEEDIKLNYINVKVVSPSFKLVSHSKIIMKHCFQNNLAAVLHF